MTEPTGEVPAVSTPEVPESETSEFITVPPDFIPAKAEDVTPPTRFGEVESYAPRTGNVDLNLTPEETAVKLSEKEANERLVQAAADAAIGASASADAAKNEPL